MNKNNHPFYEWIPRPIGILVLLLMFIPPTFSGGAYLCNINEMTGALGMMTEDIQLASFFTSIGMCLFPPFMVRFLEARRIRRTYIWCFLLLIPLCYICATTTSLPVLLAACLVTGFVRIIVMLNCTFTIAPYLTGMDTLAMFTMTETPSPNVQYALERKRTFLMPVLYFFILIISQASNMLIAWFAYHYQWQDAYYVVIAMLIFAILLVTISMPDEKKTKTYDIEWAKVPSMLFMAIALCCMAYILVYGKTLDWHYSRYIRLATGILVFSVGAFLFLSFKAKTSSYLPLNVFTYRNVWMSMLLFLATMIFNSANNFAAAYAKLSTAINNLQSASLSGWAIIGCLIGLLLSVFLIAKRMKFKYIFFIAFLLMAASNAYLYFQYQTIGLFSNMKWVVIAHYSGLLILYSVVAAFGMKSLPSHQLATFVFLMIWMRNAIAPVVGTSVYSNWLNQRQQYYTTKLAQDVDNVNTLAYQSFSAMKRASRVAGRNQFEADQFAITSIKARILKQSTIVAMKDITGQTVLLILGAAVLTLLLPYHKKETT